MPRTMVAAGLIAYLMAGCGDDSEAHPHDAGTSHADGGAHDGPDGHFGDYTQGRLLVADGDDTVHVIDLDDGSDLGTIPVSGRARLYAQRVGRYAFAVQSSANQVEIIESGVAFVSHIDHFHLSKGAPSKLPLRLEGPAPSHLVLHDGHVASFNDGDGTVQILRERAISAGTATIQTASTGAAHHGVGMVALGHLLASIPDPDGASLPIGMSLRSLEEPDAVLLESEGCPGLHGEGATRDTAVFGCIDGLLLIERADEQVSFRKVPYPGGTSSGTRIGQLFVHGDHVLGNWGQAGLMLVAIGPSTPVFTPIVIDEPVLAFALDRHGEQVLALTAAGALERYAVEDGAPLGTTQVIEEFSLEGGGQLRPALATGAASAYISDPRAGQVHEVSLRSGDVTRTFTVDGSPHSLVVYSLSPDWDHRPAHLRDDDAATATASDHDAH